MLIIGLGSEKRVGKDSLAYHIIQQRSKQEFPIVKTAFADAVKQEVNADFIQRFPLAMHHAPTAPERGSLVIGGVEHSGPPTSPVLCGMWGAWCRQHNIHLTTPVEVDFTDPMCPFGKCRQALQWWGTELRRAQDPDYWVDRMSEKILFAKSAGVKVLIITDMRFPNEHAMIKSQPGGFVWRLRRVYPFGEAPPVDNHPSERSLDNHGFDVIMWAQKLEDMLRGGLRAYDDLIQEHPNYE